MRGFKGMSVQARRWLHQCDPRWPSLSARDRWIDYGIFAGIRLRGSVNCAQFFVGLRLLEEVSVLMDLTLRLAPAGLVQRIEERCAETPPCLWGPDFRGGHLFVHGITCFGFA